MARAVLLLLFFPPGAAPRRSTRSDRGFWIPGRRVGGRRSIGSGRSAAFLASVPVTRTTLFVVASRGGRVKGLSQHHHHYHHHRQGKMPPRKQFRQMIPIDPATALGRRAEFPISLSALNSGMDLGGSGYRKKKDLPRTWRLLLFFFFCFFSFSLSCCPCFFSIGAFGKRWDGGLQKCFGNFETGLSEKKKSDWAIAYRYLASLPPFCFPVFFSPCFPPSPPPPTEPIHPPPPLVCASFLFLYPYMSVVTNKGSCTKEKCDESS